MNFRTLRADEIDCRVSTVSEKGVSILLYKDARADMNLLDETVGAENWQRKHELINGNMFCSVGIKVDGEWIWKQDVGVESYTEKEKGQASDSFKRACVNLGIGRELYTAPFIWIAPDGVNLQKKGDKTTTYDRFEVTYIEYDESRNIKALQIKNLKTNKVVYKFGISAPGGKQEPPKNTPAEEPVKENEPAEDLVKEAELKSKVIGYFNRNCTPESIQKICKLYKVDNPSKLTAEHCRHYISQLEKHGKTIDD